MPDQTSYVEQVARQAPFLEDYQRRLLASTQTLTDQPYQQYGGAQQAGFSADQLASFGLARQGIGSYAPFLAESGVYARGAPAVYAAAVPEAQNLLRGTTGAFDPSTQIAPYMNPYQQAVTQEALKELNRQNAIQQQQVAAQASKAGAFGGSRYGVQQAELGRNLAQAQAQMLASDYAKNYQQALAAGMQAYESEQARQAAAAQGLAGLASQGAGLMQQASSQMAGLGGLTQQYGAADVSMLSQSGALQQQQMQKALDIDYQKFLESQMQPYQRMAFMSDILRGVPSTQSALTATTAPAPSAAAQGIGALGAIAGIGGQNGFGWWGGD
jgi:hypothetical protein